MINPGGHPRAGRINKGYTCRPPGRPWTRGTDESLPERGWSHVDPIVGLRRHKGGARQSGARSQRREQVRRGLRRLEVSEPRDIGETWGSKCWSGPPGPLAAGGGALLPPLPHPPYLATNRAGAPRLNPGRSCCEQDRRNQAKERGLSPPLPSPSLGGICGPDDAPAAKAWHYTGADFLCLLLPTAAHRSPSLPTDCSAELKLASEL
ncbi:hypothetical protein NDU88_000942 [Pleurodeles waltl]|uniref:Uncharacterized protein n=1 Tax=Pleurodeles waltl TaxID=8319 RepID=A0AAV7U565_PLEWA|nr:hypothetical protein NDU88_000942 [Pleurodeles waltl]